MWTVELNRDVRACAKVVARIRQDTSKGGGVSNIPGETPEVLLTQSQPKRIKQHYVGCLAELGTSLLTNLAWTGCGKGAGPSGVLDVGNVIEVRSITEEHKGLIMREADHDAPFVLAFVKHPGTVSLLGWRLKRDVIDKGTPRDQDTDKPFWTMPKGDLHPMCDVMEWVSLKLESL